MKKLLSKIFSPMLIGNILAMILVIVLLCMGLWKGMAIYTRHGESVIVPDVSNRPLSEAQYILDELGLKLEVVDSSYNRKLTPGFVLEQSPAVGAQVKPGREIYLTINARETPTLVLPDIADNCSMREAEARLKTLGFKLGPTEYVAGDKDWVLDVKSAGKHVRAGDRIPIDVPVILVVGNTDTEEGELEDLEDEFFDGLLDDASTGDNEEYSE